MNCKQGDLAVVVSCAHTPEMVGRFVIVERAAKNGDEVGGVRYSFQIPPGDFVWMIRSAVEGGLLPARSNLMDHGMVPHRPMPDSQLRPIRDGEGPDETLTWKPIDEEITA